MKAVYGQDNSDAMLIKLNLAWMGAEAIFCPTATYTSDRTQEKILAQANAISNQLWFYV